MKRAKLLLATAMFFMLAIGTGFYAKSAYFNEPMCDATASAAACGKCGDGYCNPRCGETAKSCPRDCGGVTSAK